MTDSSNAPIELPMQYSAEQITSILEQSIIYSCACPAQVCSAIRQQRDLFNYQLRCLDSTATDTAVHRRIAEAVLVAHAELERCLHDILVLEGWDMNTLQMPDNLVKTLAREIDEGS